jgi:hypothetical protein
VIDISVLRITLSQKSRGILSSSPKRLGYRSQLANHSILSHQSEGPTYSQINTRSHKDGTCSSHSCFFQRLHALFRCRHRRIQILDVNSRGVYKSSIRELPLVLLSQESDADHLIRNENMAPSSPCSSQAPRNVFVDETKPMNRSRNNRDLKCDKSIASKLLS